MNLQPGHRYNIYGTRYGGKPFSYEDVKYVGEGPSPATNDWKLCFQPKEGALAVYIPESYIEEIEELS